MKIKAFITHKLAEKYSDCQDYFHINPQRHSIAVADGMSQSIFPQWWAEELALAYTNGEDINNQIQVLQNNWRSRVDNRISEKEHEKPNSAWRIIDNLSLNRGAGSTLCGIKFDGQRWSSFILGDTSLIIVNNDFHIKEIINTNQGAFTNHPDYFDSLRQKVGKEVEKKGILEENSYILIVSDPLGELLELKHQKGEESEFIEKLISIENHQEFTETIDNWRNLEHLHNDDTTCVVIQENGNSDFEMIYVDDVKKLIEEQIYDETSLPNLTKEIEKKNLNVAEINKGDIDSFKNDDLDILVKFSNEIIQLFKNNDNKGEGKSPGKKRKRKGRDLHNIRLKFYTQTNAKMDNVKQILDKYPSIELIITKYLS